MQRSFMAFMLLYILGINSPISSMHQDTKYENRELGLINLDIYLNNRELLEPFLIKTINDNNIDPLSQILAHIDINYKFGGSGVYNGNTLLMYAISKYKADIVEFLIKNGADLNAQDNNGDTALILSVKNRFKKAVYCLINNSSIDINVQNNNGCTALIFAAKFDYPEILAILAPKANVDIADKDNHTALMYTVIQDNIISTTLLLKAQANPNIKTSDGHYPLTYSLKNKQYAISELLLQYNADPYLQDKFKNNALTYAKRQNYKEFLDLSRNLCK